MGCMKASAAAGLALRADPFALLRYADTAGETHRGPVMREQLLHFYNLYPSRPENPFVLMHLADSYKEAGRWEDASIFYAALLSQYPDAQVVPTARLRYADVQEHLTPEGEEVNLRHTIAAHLANVPLKPGEMLSPRQLFESSAKQYEDSPVGSEALFHLGEALERAGKREDALKAYEQVVQRAGKFENDPWPEKGGAQLVRFLRPRLEAALKAGDDFELINLFHRNGPFADRLYAGTELLLKVAEAHRRLGFPIESARLFQSLIRDESRGFSRSRLNGSRRELPGTKRHAGGPCRLRAVSPAISRRPVRWTGSDWNPDVLRGEGNTSGLVKLESSG